MTEAIVVRQMGGSGMHFATSMMQLQAEAPVGPGACARSSIFGRGSAPATEEFVNER